MPDTYDFAGFYGNDPWGDVTQNERTWYDPVLRDMYQRSSAYSQYANMKVDLNGPKARTIFFNDLIPPRPNITPLTNRAQESTRLYTDSYQKSVTTERGGNGMALHRESEMFSYWQRGGQYGLLPIIQQSLGHVMIDHLDLLCRNAFLTHPYPYFGNGSATGFSGITHSNVGDKATTELLDSVWLKLTTRQMPFNALPTTYPMGTEPIVVCSHGFVHDLKREIGTGAGGLNFVDINKYTEAGRTTLLAGEMGMYRGFRFVANDMAVLFNSGAIVTQTNITAAVQPGDGAPDPQTTLVEGVRRVGQPGAIHTITVVSTAGLASGQIIAIHRVKAQAADVLTGRAVLNGVLYTDPMLQNVEIHAVINGTTLSLKEPYMMSQENGKGLETDLGAGVFGYVTLAKHVHSALFLNPAQTSGIIAGVAQPPVIYTPRPVDDFESMYRISYDFWLKYALWEPRVFQTWFGTGANVTTGAVFY